MADGRQRDAWVRQSHVMAVLAQVNGVKKSPDDFNPYSQKGIVKIKGSEMVATLKSVFVDPHHG